MYMREEEKEKINKYKFMPAKASDYKGWNSEHSADKNVFTVPWYSDNEGYWITDESYKLEFIPRIKSKGTSEYDITIIDGKVYTFKHYRYYFDEDGNELYYDLRPDPLIEKRKIEKEARLINGRSLPKRIKDFNKYYSFSQGPAIPICIIISLICILLFNGGWAILFVTIPYVIYGLYKEATYGTRWK